MSGLACRFCRAALSHTFVDLGMSPVSNAFLKAEQLNGIEPFYPLHAYVCGTCFLVQLDQFEPPDRIFNDEYAYFSSFSDSWLEHARRYAEQIIAGLVLGARSFVVEVASNDGYLLQYFMQRGIPALGVEPAANCAEVARGKGVETLVKFFGVQTATELANAGHKADLLVGNNVLGHVPELHDFVAGMKILLKDTGVITMEFPHLLSLMRENQFDTVYHEHFSYFSLLTVTRIFQAHGLRIFDVERLSTHGGSLRIYVCHTANALQPERPSVAALFAEERMARLDQLAPYSDFSEQVKATKRALLDFLTVTKRSGKSIVGYGAPAKGNTLLNYCGVGTDFIDYTVDRSPHKQGMYLPGVHIPVHAPSKILETKPDYVLILPWNIKDEIVGQMAGVREWGGRFVVPIPEVTVLN